MKKVFFVVVNYNGKEVIEACLRSIFASQYAGFEVVVVDNASRDGSMTLVKAQFPKVHCIFHETNTGFSGGVNAGIRFALEHGAEYVFLLNNDATVSEETVPILMRYAEKNPKSVFSPIVLSSREPRRVWFSGGNIDWFRMRAVHTEAKELSDTPYGTEYLSGCAMLIPKKAFFEAGLFDEAYFLYYEDADWCVRARSFGYALWIVPSAEVVHGEQSEKRNSLKIYFLVLSGLIFFEKNAFGFWRWWGRLYFFLRICKNETDRRFHWGDPVIVEKVSHAYKDFKNKVPLRYYRALRRE